MRLVCVICAERLDAESVMSACKCGHVIHAECLMRWISTDKSCPKCRAPANQKNIIKRLFFDLSSSPTRSFVPASVSSSVTSPVSSRDKENDALSGTVWSRFSSFLAGQQLAESKQKLHEMRGRLQRRDTTIIKLKEELAEMRSYMNNTLEELEDQQTLIRQVRYTKNPIANTKRSSQNINNMLCCRV